MYFILTVLKGQSHKNCRDFSANGTSFRVFEVKLSVRLGRKENNRV